MDYAKVKQLLEQGSRKGYGDSEWLDELTETEDGRFIAVFKGQSFYSEHVDSVTVKEVKKRGLQAAYNRAQADMEVQNYRKLFPNWSDETLAGYAMHLCFKELASVSTRY